MHILEELQVLKQPEHGNRARIRSDRENKLIEIRIDGNVEWRRTFLTTIRNGFQVIHDSIPHLPYEERIPLPDASNVTINYEDLLLRLEDGEKTVRPEGARKRYDIMELLNGIGGIKVDRKRLEEALVDAFTPFDLKKMLKQNWIFHSITLHQTKHIWRKLCLILLITLRNVTD